MNLVLFMFAGRRVNMEVQKPYLDAILSQYPQAQLHLWDLTRDAVDQGYIRTLIGAHDGRVRVLDLLHPGHPIQCMYPDGYPGGKKPRGWRSCRCLKHRPPYEKPYLYYAQREEYRDTVFVKIDDDVLFLETDRFADLIDPLADHPNRVISANVINNAVCAKYEPELAEAFGQHYTLDGMHVVGDPALPENDKRWWALHCEAQFARECHEWFFNEWATMGRPTSYVRTRPGEAISINCIAFTHRTMRRIAGMVNDRLGDEGAVDRMLPWICRSFHAAHLTFGPQDAAMEPEELDQIRAAYIQLRKDYLS